MQCFPRGKSNIGWCLLLLSTLMATNANADVRLWVSASTVNGNGSGNPGRAGLDSTCDGDGNKPTLASSTTRAFISVTGADEIRDMVANYSIPSAEVIYRADGTTQIAANFAALLNSGSVALTNAVMGGTGIWTGSTATGALNGTFHCGNWTDNSGGSSARFGDGTLKDSHFLSTNAAQCNLLGNLYCITYTSSTPAPAPAVPKVSTLPLYLD